MAASSTFSSLLRSSPALLSDHRSPPPSRCSVSSSPLLPGAPRSSRLGFAVPERRKNLVVVNSTIGEVSFRDPSTSGSGGDERIESLKLKLLSVVSGLNRGLVASVDDLQRAEIAAKELENAGGPVDLTDDLDKLQGKWRLLYSSAFSSRSLGGSRPGLPTGRLIPVTLGQIPPFDIPRLPDSFRPPSNPGTGDFEVTFVDGNMRITRGDRGELRVFVIA
ncbi:unnamed protein product [Thlaspi arvense]|uniref:Plastid lipid-associated protein/fibrillin conserved domain-containing protein n=1 Tax=Thlaspi arvense TaxID=13288 RepID=A0AAU9RWV0_THLAR|nr:unnamed protein product [Thlaspi arvense]